MTRAQFVPLAFPPQENTMTRTPSPRTGWKLLLAAAALTGATSLAFAAGPGERGGHHGRGHAAGMFERIDANGDGVVTRAEFDAHLAARQAGLDANGDGFVSFEEAQTFRAAQQEERARERFARMDTNGDGRISVEEASARQARMFEFMDRNDDGVVDADERSPRRWGKGDGKREDARPGR